MHIARRFARDRRGTIAILAAVSVSALMGSATLALDVTQFYLAQSNGQLIADQSAKAAAFAYIQSSGSATTAQKAAWSLAVVNGVGISTVTTSIVNSPSGDGNKAAQVSVVTPVSLTAFSSFATQLTSLNVSATSYAEIQSDVSGCVIALSSSGVSASGGANMAASGCAIGSGGGISASGGAAVTAQAVYAVGSISQASGSSLTTSPAAGQLFPGSSTPTDPYAGANVFSRLPTVSALTAAGFPSVGSAPSGGSNLACAFPVTSGVHGTVTVGSTCSFSGGAETDITALSLTSSNVTLNFAAGTYKINGGLNASGKTTLTVNTTGNVVFEIWNGINLSGSSTMTFNGTASYYVHGGIANNSSGAMVFNNTTSASPSTFFVAGGMNLLNGRTTFPAGYYTITSGSGSTGPGITLGRAVSVTFGNGSFTVANGINMGGSSTLTFGSQINAKGVFQIPNVPSGSNAISTGGSSTLTIGAFPNVDINGPVAFAGSVRLGSGAYTINGAFGASSGGGFITGSGVSIISAGAMSFGAGYSSIMLSAPSTISSSTAGTLATVALASQSAAASTITAGASDTRVIGAVYLPSAALTLGGAGKLSGDGGCLMIVGSSISLSGGSFATTCPTLGGATGSVALVQ